MYKLSPLQMGLLNLLADGQGYTGNFLGQELGISRAAIEQEIKQLRHLGIAISRLSSGYRLNIPMKLLDIDQIIIYLNQLNFFNPINFHLFASLDSTNNFLKSIDNSPHISVCLAEKQTHGRGRLGQQWVSPFGVNLYFSSRWHFNCNLSKLSGLSLVVSLCLQACLKNYGIHNVWVKWPNDLIWQDQKLGGILIEVIAERNDSIEVIIGIGLNVNMSNASSETPENAWCSLHKITGNCWDRNPLIASVLNYLTNYLRVFTEKGFLPFHNEWNKVDYLRGHFICLSHPTGSKFGYVTGVSNQGHLLLTEEGTGKELLLSAGETNLLRKKVCPKFD